MERRKTSPRKAGTALRGGTVFELLRVIHTPLLWWQFSGSARMSYQRRSRPPSPPLRYPPRPPSPPPPNERPPPARGSCGLASFTVRARPCMSAPLKRSIAVAMSCALAISTKPNPRDRPVILSMITVAEVTAPTWPNRASRSALVVENERLPTNNFVATKNLQTQKGPENHECGSRGQLSLEPNSAGQQNKPDTETIAGLCPNASQESAHQRAGAGA